jgi:hypothetical protein
MVTMMTKTEAGSIVTKAMQTAAGTAKVRVGKKADIRLTPDNMG